MANTETYGNKTDSDPQSSAYEYQYRKDYLEDWTIHRNYVTTFDAYEAMLIGLVFDSVSLSTDGSKITDSYAATLAIERAARVMGKLPDGVTVPLGKSDQGKAAFMDILREKWIYPNANAQRDFETKLRLWQLYSSVYGYMPMFYDWNVSTTGYVGPDCWLWNPRNLIPQQGRVSIPDMDHVHALTYVGKSYLQNIMDNPEAGDGWNRDAVQELLEMVDSETTGKDAQKDTLIDRTRVPQSVKKGICLVTRYEAGEDGQWCTFAPDHGYCQVRELKNPHKNGRIPFVIKYSQPLFDSFYGLGEFQRAKPLQFARDGLTNFYFKGIKMNLIPPLVANANGVLKHTLDYREGAVMLETVPNSIRRLDTSNAGLATYQAVQTSLTGSLLSLYGTQNASIPGADALNPSQGKTPQAISLYGDKEATRDGQERANLEAAIEELTSGFFSLVVNIGTEKIPVNLFFDDIKEIVKSGLTDVEDIFKNFKENATGTGGQLTIDPSKLKGQEYRFFINYGSTAKQNQDAQREALENWMATIGKLQNVIQQDPTITVNWPKIMEVYDELSSIDGVDEFITVNPNATPPAPPPQAAAVPSATAVNAPGGQVHEVADLVELYLKTTDVGLQQQIIQSMGFTPSPPAQPPAAPPTITPSGHAFNDPAIGAAAAALQAHAAGSSPPPPPEVPPTPVEPPVPPTVAPGGMSFHDPQIGQVASEIVKSAQNSPPPPPEVPPKPATKKSTKSKK